MVKAQQEVSKTEQAPVKSKSLKKALKKGAVLAVAAGAVYLVWQNPQWLDKAGSFFESRAVTLNSSENSDYSVKTDETTLLRQEVNYLRNQVALLQKIQAEQTDTAALEEKFANLEKANNAIIDSKADVASVLGLVTRVDKAEERLDDLSRVTDEGAVILTATMMVKDSAERGGSFIYEAEILQQLAGDNVKLKEPVAVINKYAEKGIENNVYLIKSFKKVYADLLKKQREEFEKTWKDRLNNKLSEYIKVKRVNENTPQFQANQELAEVKEAVDSGNIKKALADLQNINNKELLNEPSLKDWLTEARAKVEFNDAVARISTYYLAALKVNFIKKETKHD